MWDYKKKKRNTGKVKRKGMTTIHIFLKRPEKEQLRN